MMARRGPLLSVKRLVVRADRIACDVVMAPGASRATSHALIERVCDAFPNLPRHACVNDEGDTFAAVMDHTPVPHLLEHLVIDAQVRAAVAASDGKGSSTNAIFTGTTEWVDEGAGLARVEVSFTDDLVALRAFRDAVRFLNEVVVP